MGWERVFEEACRLVLAGATRHDAAARLVEVAARDRAALEKARFHFLGMTLDRPDDADSARALAAIDEALRLGAAQGAWTAPTGPASSALWR